MPFNPLSKKEEIIMSRGEAYKVLSLSVLFKQSPPKEKKEAVKQLKQKWAEKFGS